VGDLVRQSADTSLTASCSIVAQRLRQVVEVRGDVSNCTLQSQRELPLPPVARSLDKNRDFPLLHKDRNDSFLRSLARIAMALLCDSRSYTLGRRLHVFRLAREQRASDAFALASFRAMRKARRR
jgi:hypothetical protein